LFGLPVLQILYLGHWDVEILGKMSLLWRTQTQPEFHEKSALFPGQEHGRTPHRNKKDDPTPDKQKDAGERDTRGNNQSVAGNNQERNRQAQGRKSRETGNETGTST